MKYKLTIILSLSLIWGTEKSSAFCGFYVAKAGAELFNQKSEVILVRDGLKTIITMSNDFSGNVKDFAMVVPVPRVLKREDIRIAESRIFQTLDNYSSPRLVEYYDDNPCRRDKYLMYEKRFEAMEDSAPSKELKKSANHNGVKIEAVYAIGEYDILILSAKESGGLKAFLIENGYSVPKKAEKVLGPYIKSNMKFFVVKVNLAKFKIGGVNSLRPLQISFESEKFMLPIRLGMANSKGVQDMIVYAFTKTGRIEAANYRTVKIPTDRNIPIRVKNVFGKFYAALFEKSYLNENKNVVFLEYAWTVTPSWSGVKCDPCVGNPPFPADFFAAGVNWTSTGAPVFFTRLHVRYSEEHFPQDLLFLVTPNTEHFQARYVLTNPASGSLDCPEGIKYTEELKQRQWVEEMELASLTGWNQIQPGEKTEKDENTIVPSVPDLFRNHFIKKYWAGILMLLTVLFLAFFIRKREMKMSHF